jgi:Ca2+:H+ antiporter
MKDILPTDPPKKSLMKKVDFDLSHAVAVFAFVVLLVVFFAPTLTPFLTIVAIAFLGVAVTNSVHHAEVIAARLGPSMGALILALAVTVIEVGLIVSLMTNDSPESAMIARDTVFSALIIVTNGIVGVCLLLGGLRHNVLGFQPQGTNSLLAVLAALAGLTLVLPNFTTSTPGPTYSNWQLIYASVASLILYFSLVLAQTKTQRDYFEPAAIPGADAVEDHRPSLLKTRLSFAGLVVSLLAVIGLAKTLSPAIESGLAAVGAPRAVVGIVIALLVLLPETWAAVSAARANQLQTSLNLALGSGAASIALTIPVVSIFTIATNRTLALGLDSKGIAFLVLTFITCGLTLGTGKTTVLQGAVHLVLLSAYLVMAFIP